MPATPTPWRIREVQPSDAEDIIALLKTSFAEPGNNLLMEADEFTMTLDEEESFLTEQSLRTDWIGYVAVTREKPTRVIGLVTAEGKQRRAIKHRASIGITIANMWRGQGIGKALMRQVIKWAKETEGITRLELEVLARNEVAVHLYERLGFEREGVIRRAIFRDGVYLDEYVMGLLL